MCSNDKRHNYRERKVMRTEQQIRDEMNVARNEFRKLNQELLDLQSESKAKLGDKVYLVTVEYVVRANVVVCAPNFETATDYICDNETPFGEYLEDSFVVNPDGEKEDYMIQGYVS